MSDYYHANKMDRNGCPKCGAPNGRDNKYKFSCSECSFAFP